MVRGQEGLWDELRREVKHLAMEKKFNIWSGVAEKAKLILKPIRRNFGRL